MQLTSSLWDVTSSQPPAHHPPTASALGLWREWLDSGRRSTARLGTAHRWQESTCYPPVQTQKELGCRSGPEVCSRIREFSSVNSQQFHSPLVSVRIITDMTWWRSSAGLARHFYPKVFSVGDTKLVNHCVVCMWCEHLCVCAHLYMYVCVHICMHVCCMYLACMCDLRIHLSVCLLPFA